MALTDELEKLKNSEIAIVMNDGMTYRGILTKFDEDTIVLEQVFEAYHGQVDWIKSSNAQEGGGNTLKGYLSWRRITLPKLFARSDRVLRVWPWIISEKQ
jgi:small nuclear ribonucleoprotein (snRNP)-like protein